MSLAHGWIFAGGAAAAGAVAGLAASGILHKAAVGITTGAMTAADAVSKETQAIADDANDRRAEARRRAKIDAGVKEEIAKLEPDIREKVTARVDGAAQAEAGDATATA